MRDIVVAITAASYSGNKGAAAMLQSSIKQLYDKYGAQLNINLMSVYPMEDKKQVPFDFINIISCKPEQLMFIAFPLAILYKLLKWVSPVRKVLEKNKIIKAYKNSDLVIDEAGISFVDSRGFIMNIYAFICIAVPMLVGTPVVKYSQALGSFGKMYNRIIAKFILPKCRLICARGEQTYNNLVKIGVKSNVKLCADGAFTMEDSEYWYNEIRLITENDIFYHSDVIGLSLSSVVEKKCRRLKINYQKIMIDFINYLNDKGFNVLLIANAARKDSEKPRNNDLMICNTIYGEVKNKEKVRWYSKEMDAEEIRSYIGKCRILIASRFHAMIGALEKKVPVLLIGWSHKYQEILDMFNLGQYAIDYSNLSLETLQSEFYGFLEHELEIKENIKNNIEAVMMSSKLNIKYINEIIEDIIANSRSNNLLLKTEQPDKYLGSHLTCRIGYSTDEQLRRNASSGGMVTALLCHLLETKQINGAWVTKSVINDNVLSYKTFIATTKEEIMDCSSSIYMDIPILKHINIIKEFKGRIAVVLTPCKIRSLAAMMEKDKLLKDKIAVKLALYCCGNNTENATLLPLSKAKISLCNAVRIYYKRGHWRGKSSVLYSDGSEKNFSYSKTICAYRNAYFFEKSSCMLCQDHFGVSSDISFGDVWLNEMKSNPIKHTSCIIRNEKALKMYQSAINAGAIKDNHISDTKIILSQKRALVFKFNCAKAKVDYYKKLGKNVPLDISNRCKWNHRLAYFLANRNNKFSKEHYEILKKTPMRIVYYYMCFIRVLLSF